MYPRIEASSEAFFQRCRDMRPAFFAEVFQRFTARLVTAVPPRYAAEVAPVRARFAALVILDGSRLAAIAHRPKLLWNERAVVLPGCLLGVYDLGRGLCRQLSFSADTAASEMTRAKEAVAGLGRDTLQSTVPGIGRRSTSRPYGPIVESRARGDGPWKCC